MNLKIKIAFLSFLLTFSSLVIMTPMLVLADAGETVKEGLDTTAKTADITIGKQTGAAALGTFVGRGINYVFSAVGMIFVLIMLIGAYLWMTAKGAEEQISKAKTFLLNGIFGLMVIFGVWGMAYVIIKFLALSTGVLK